MTNPFHIAPVTIAGAAIPLSNYATGKPKNLKTLLIDNTGTGTVFIGSSDMNITSLAGVVLRVPAGEYRSIGGVISANNIEWEGFYIHGDNAGDIALITGQTVS